MPFLIAAVDVPDQRRQYYIGVKRRMPGRQAIQVTDVEDTATRFATQEEAEATLADLGDGFRVIEVEK